MDEDRANAGQESPWAPTVKNVDAAAQEQSGGVLGTLGRMAEWGGEGVSGAVNGAKDAAGDLWDWMGG
jgi:hypothetical protein